MMRKRNEWKAGRCFALVLLVVPAGVSPGSLFAQPGLPTLSINDVTLDESSCEGPNFVFTVTLSHLGRQPVTVNYATSDGSPSGLGAAAVGGKDYVSTSGTLTFDHSTPPNGPRGSFVRTITVPLGDYIVSTGSNDERAFVVNLSGATNATISRPQGVGTLLSAATSCTPAENAGCFVNYCGATRACKQVNRSACGIPFPVLSAQGGQDFAACANAGLWRDSDHDGLSDAAEAQGYIDVNCNGVNDGPAIDVQLPGADPHVPDVYLHYDYVAAGDHDHNPPAEAIQWMVDAFAAHGANLHIDPQHNAIGESAAQVVTLGAPLTGGVDPACAGPRAKSMRQLREEINFGFRKLAYHYMVFSHYATCPDAAHCAACPNDQENPACVQPASPPAATNLGTAEILGDDAIVATGPLIDLGIPIASAPLELWAGLSMHELGHNLGLLHGGPDCYNNKPNYIGVMNYRFYTDGIPVAASPGDILPKSCTTDADCPAAGFAGHAVRAHCSAAGAAFPQSNTCFRIDYSDRLFQTPDETNLDESAGLQGGANNTDISWRHEVSPRTGFVRVPTNGSPIDWNNNGVIETGVVFDVNGDTGTNPLPGQNDWETATDFFGNLFFTRLHFDFVTSPFFLNDGGPPLATSTQAAASASQAETKNVARPQQ